MAARLELTFHSPVPIIGEMITVRGNFTFVAQRQNAFEVSIEPNNFPTVVGPRFRDAFNSDVNYLGESTVSGRIEYTDENMENALYILTITHPDDDYFGTINNSTSFISHELTIIDDGGVPDDRPEPVALNAEITSSSTPCHNYTLNITASRSGYVRVEFPIGYEVKEFAVNDFYSLELARPAEIGVGIINFFDSIDDSVIINSVTFKPPTILHVNGAHVVGSPFGASVTIEVDSENVVYSLDNESWQGSPQFFGMTIGRYTAYVRDQCGCTKTIQFEVLEEHVQGLTASPYIQVSIQNSLRFADRGKNNFLGVLSSERTRCYYHEYVIGDTVSTQIKSSYPSNKAFLVLDDESEIEVPLIRKSDNINRISIYEGNYREIDGRLAVYFTAGEIFNPDGSVNGEHLLSGRLPLWYGRGVYVDIEGIGPTQIERLYHDQDSETTYAITQMDGLGSALGRKITSIHSAHPYEVYEFEVEFVLTGTYQIKIEYGENGKFLSELILVHSKLPDNYKEVQWFNSKNNDIFYATGIKNFRRIPFEKDFTLTPRAEKETYSTDTSVELVNSKTFAVYPIVFAAMPMEVARGLQTGLDNSDTIVIDGAVFVCESPVEIEEDGLWYNVTADLTLTKDRSFPERDILEARFLLIEEDQESLLLIGETNTGLLRI